MQEEPLQQFSEFISGLKRGQVDDELTAALAALVQEVNDIGKPGSLTVQIKVSKDDARMLSVVEKVSVTHPKTPRGSSLWFADASGGLHRDDPYQTRAFNNEDQEHQS